MQISFYTHNSAQDFSNKSSELFPDPPKRCPFKDCSLPVKLKKHGYYSRYFISKTFKGSIFLRRYICPVCGRTISMLPMFCLQRFQYSGLDIVNLLHEFYQGEISLMKLIRCEATPRRQQSRWDWHRLRFRRGRSTSAVQVYRDSIQQLFPECCNPNPLPNSLERCSVCFVPSVIPPFSAAAGRSGRK
jgi:hypothetical protein